MGGDLARASLSSANSWSSFVTAAGMFKSSNRRAS